MVDIESKAAGDPLPGHTRSLDISAQALGKIASFSLLAFVLAGCAPRRAQAQFIGYVSPQTVQQTLATAKTCSGAVQTLAINNLGQTQHYLQVASVAGVTSFKAQLVGQDGFGNTYPISDVLMVNGGNQGNVKGSGYFPAIFLQVTCTPNTATYSASYSGAWGTFDSTVGSYLSAQTDKSVFSGLAENANQTLSFQTPFASSAGQISFSYSAGGAGGSINVQCANNQFAGAFAAQVFSATLANTTSPQLFQVGDFPCPTLTLNYVNNGTGGTISAEYGFNQPGQARLANQYTHITGTTATVVKATYGVLHTVSINTGGAGTVSVFDLASASCTGTPSTNTVAVITAVAATLQTFTYDTNLLNGICVKASAAMDITVSAQ
jgi:hypothetical protein